MSEETKIKNAIKRAKTHKEVMTERTRRIRMRFFCRIIQQGFGFAILVGIITFASSFEFLRSIEDNPGTTEIVIFSILSMGAII